MGMESKQRVGVVCIAPRIADPSSRAFRNLYEGVGKNTGNYMFTQAMFRQLAGTVHPIGFAFNPARVNAEFDFVVIPAANWLNANADWDWLTAILEQVEIPVITIGIGLQANSLELDKVVVSESARRLVQVLSQKATLLSTRGNFTRDWLHGIGIQNAVTTGCPSLYMKVGQGQRREGEGLVFQSTRYGMSPAFLKEKSLNRDIFRLPKICGGDMVFQSEIEELEYLVYRERAEAIDGAQAEELHALYGLERDELKDFLSRHGHVFFDLEEWSGYLRTREGVIGTRLHGAILALNNGVPAVLLAHDSRTAEVIEFANIPTFVPEKPLAEYAADDWRRVLADADVGSFETTRRKNRDIYIDFLIRNGLALNLDGLID